MPMYRGMGTTVDRDHNLPLLNHVTATASHWLLPSDRYAYALARTTTAILNLGTRSQSQQKR